MFCHCHIYCTSKYGIFATLRRPRRHRQRATSQPRFPLRDSQPGLWGKSWTVAAWCELRNDFRNFRLDRIVDLTPTAETFEDEPCRRLRDYLRQIGDFAERILDD